MGTLQKKPCELLPSSHSKDLKMFPPANRTKIDDIYLN